MGRKRTRHQRYELPVWDAQRAGRDMTKVLLWVLGIAVALLVALFWATPADAQPAFAARVASTDVIYDPTFTALTAEDLDRWGRLMPFDERTTRTETTQGVMYCKTLRFFIPAASPSMTLQPQDCSGYEDLYVQNFQCLYSATPCFLPAGVTTPIGGQTGNIFGTVGYASAEFGLLASLSPIADGSDTSLGVVGGAMYLHGPTLMTPVPTEEELVLGVTVLNYSIPFPFNPSDPGVLQIRRPAYTWVRNGIQRFRRIYSFPRVGLHVAVNSTTQCVMMHFVGKVIPT